MTRFLLALLLAVPAHSFSQAIPFDQRPPVASLTASAVSILHYSQNGHNRTLWGWSATPEVNLNMHLGLQADVGNAYMRSVYPGQNRIFVAAGPRYTFAPISHAAPFLFAEGGEIKATSEGGTLVNDWHPLVSLGAGFEYHALRHLSLTLIPAEYLGQQEDDGTWTHAFAARAGFTVYLYR